MSLKYTMLQLAVDTSVKVHTNAGNDGDPSTTINNVSKLGADSVMSGILNGVYFMIGIAAVISIIVGGIIYATSGGDPNGAKRGKDIILYAIIGLVVSLMAFVITGFVIARVG